MLSRCFSLVPVMMLLVMPTSSGQRERDLFNYGQEWNTWSNGSRYVYLEGFVDGQSNTYAAVLGDLPQERREPLRLQLFTFYGAQALRDVMTSLYADPANTFIRYDSMVYIARDKLSGKDTESMLRSAREHDRGYVK